MQYVAKYMLRKEMAARKEGQLDISGSDLAELALCGRTAQH